MQRSSSLVLSCLAVTSGQCRYGLHLLPTHNLLNTLLLFIHVQTSQPFSQPALWQASNYRTQEVPLYSPFSLSTSVSKFSERFPPLATWVIDPNTRNPSHEIGLTCRICTPLFSPFDVYFLNIDRYSLRSYVHMYTLYIMRNKGLCHFSLWAYIMLARSICYC